MDLITTAHIDQITNIVKVLVPTTYSIDCNAQRTKTPSINITYLQPFNQIYHTLDEFYRLQINAASADALETVIDLLLKGNSRYPEGYTGYTDIGYGDFTANAFLVVQKDISNQMIATITQTPRVGRGVLNGISYDFRTYLEYDGVTVSTLIQSYFTLTPIQTLSKTVTITIKPVTNVNLTQLNAIIAANGYLLETDLTYGSPLVLSDQNWTDGSELSENLIDDILVNNLFEITGSYLASYGDPDEYIIDERGETLNMYWAYTNGIYSSTTNQFYMRWGYAVDATADNYANFDLTDFQAITSIVFRVKANNSVSFPGIGVKFIITENAINGLAHTDLVGQTRDTVVGNELDSISYLIPSWVENTVYDYEIPIAWLDYWEGPILGIISQGLVNISVLISEVHLIINGTYIVDTIATFENATLTAGNTYINTEYPIGIQTECQHKHETQADLLLKARWPL